LLTSTSSRSASSTPLRTLSFTDSMLISAF